MKCLKLEILMAVMCCALYSIDHSFAQPERIETSDSAAKAEKIQANDSRVKDLPEFAALGDMWLVDGLLISGQAKTLMSHDQATKFCKKLDRKKNWLGFYSSGAAKVPSQKSWQVIAKAMITHPDFATHVGDHEFWTSTVVGDDPFDWSYVTFDSGSRIFYEVNSNENYNFCAFYGCIPRPARFVRCIRRF